MEHKLIKTFIYIVYLKLIALPSPCVTWLAKLLTFLVLAIEPCSCVQAWELLGSCKKMTRVNNLISPRKLQVEILALLIHIMESLMCHCAIISRLKNTNNNTNNLSCIQSVLCLLCLSH